MRWAFIFIALFVAAVAGIAYSRNPDACRKMIHDALAIVQGEPPPAPPPPPPMASDHPEVPVAAVPTPAAPPPPPYVYSGPVKGWTPPDVLPAQANWNWTTFDGKTFENVVVTKIEQDTVSITHSNGVAHLPMAMLPADIRKQLGYDSDAEAAWKKEQDREVLHPYYTFANLKAAQDAAKQMHWPLAWICGNGAALNAANPPMGSEDDVTQMAMADLKPQAIIIFLEGNVDLMKISPLLREGQFFQMDDGPVPGGHHFFAPKIVFSDADVTKALGRIAYMQMKVGREAAIDQVIATFRTPAQ